MKTHVSVFRSHAAHAEMEKSSGNLSSYYYSNIFWIEYARIDGLSVDCANKPMPSRCLSLAATAFVRFNFSFLGNNKRSWAKKADRIFGCAKKTIVAHEVSWENSPSPTNVDECAIENASRSYHLKELLCVVVVVCDDDACHALWPHASVPMVGAWVWCKWIFYSLPLHVTWTRCHNHRWIRNKSSTTRLHAERFGRMPDTGCWSLRTERESMKVRVTCRFHLS